MPMNETRSSLRAFAAVFGVLILVVAGVGAIYFEYVQSRRAYLTNKRYRALSSIGEGLGDAIVGLQEGFDNGIKAIKDIKDIEPCPVMSNSNLSDWTRYAGAKPLERFVPNLECATAPDGFANGQEKAPAGLYLVEEHGEPLLYLTRDGVWGRVKLGLLLEKSAAAENLGDLMLATADGAVLYQQSSRPIANLLDLLEAPEPRKSDTDDHKDTAKASGDKPGTPDKDATKAPPKRKPFVPGRTEDVQFMDEPHDLFGTPVRAPKLLLTTRTTENAPPVETSLVVARLVPKAGLQRSERSVPLTWVLALLIVLMLTMLAWPLLKLWSVGSRERLLALDVKVLVVCSVLSAGILSFALQLIPLHRTLVASFDRQATRLAGDVEKRLRHDLAKGNRLLSRTARTGEPGPGEGFHDYNDLVLIDEKGKASSNWSPEPRLEQSRVAWESTPRPPLRVDVRDRTYFRQAQQRQYWGFKLAGEPGSPNRTGFVVETIRSKKTGDFAVALATASPSMGPRGVALLTLGMHGFDNPVVSAPFTFALVDAAGNVQLHANSSKNGHENLLLECDGHTGLRAALRARRAAHFDARCYGTSYRLYTRPLRGMPWSVVVFRDKHPLQALSADLAMAWGVAFGIAFLALFAPVLLAQAIWPGCCTDWLWARRALAGRYLTAAMQLALTAVLGIWAIPRLPGLAEGAALLLLPVVTVAFLSLVLIDRPSAGRSAVAGVAACGGATLLVLAVQARDWVAFVAFGATGAIWCWEIVRRREGSAASAVVSMGAAATLGLLLLPRMAALSIAALTATITLPAGMALAPKSISENRESAFRFSYVAMLLGLLVVLAVVPAVILFREAEQYALTALVKHAQLDFTTAILERTNRIRVQVAKLYENDPGVIEGVIAERLADTRNVFASSWLGWPVERLGRYAGTRDGGTVDTTACGGNATSLNPLTHWMVSALPPYQPLAADLHATASQGAADGAWCWTRSADGAIDLVLKDPGLATLVGSPGATPSAFWKGRRAAGPLRWHPGVVVVLWVLAGIVVFALLWSIARLVFVLDADSQGRFGAHPDGEASGRSVFLFATTDGALVPLREGPTTALLDLRVAGGPASLEGWACGPEALKPDIEIDHLEAALADPARAEATRALLQGLVHKKRRILVTSEIDPLYHLSCDPVSPQPADGKAGTAVPADRDSLRRGWADLLAAFSMRQASVDADPLLAERYPHGTYDGKRAEDENDERLRGRNWAIWNHSTRAERVALRQLADEGFLNPRDVETAHQLMRRGLAHRAPRLALLDASLRRFVQRAVSAHEIDVWEHEEGPSGWTRLRAPLLGLLVLATGFLFVTQRDAFNSTMALVTALAAAIPVLVRTFGLLREQKATSTTS